MKKTLFFLSTLIISISLFSQRPDECSKIFIPRQPRPAYGQAQEINPYPEKFQALVCFNKGEYNYREDALNILDSIYKLVFNNENGRFYKITILGYDDEEMVTEDNTDLARKRTITVFNYFSQREETEYIIRRTPSVYYNSCSGEHDCVIKYKMPFDFKWQSINTLNEKEKSFNGISLASKALIIVEDAPEECLGKFNDYYYPSQDSNIVGKESILRVPKGALGYITHTKDTISYDMKLEYEEVFSFEDVTRNYNLIPHHRQYILCAGYFVIKSNKTPDYERCKDNLDNYPATINIKLPIEEHQQRARLRFYAKTYRPNGTWEYRAIPTKRERNPHTKDVTLIAEFSAFQLDTIYLGRRVVEKDMSKFFYPAQEGEPGAFSAMGGWLKPYKLDKRGMIIMKKSMEEILRTPLNR